MEHLEDRRLLAANIVPKAVDDTATTVGNVPVLVNLVANDYDRDGSVNPASVAITSGPKAGKVAIRVDGMIRYTPPQDRFGVDSFAYSVQDNTGALSNTALVSILVRSAYQNPDIAQDVNDDGGYSPIDALQLITELNATGSRKLVHPPTQETAPPPYLDVNGDGYLTPADPKGVIDCLNSYFAGLVSGSQSCRTEPLPPMQDSGSASTSDASIPDEIPPDVASGDDPVSDLEQPEQPEEPQQPTADDLDDVLTAEDDEITGMGSLIASGSKAATQDDDEQPVLLPDDLLDWDDLV
jgi:hypothetical protein